MSLGQGPFSMLTTPGRHHVRANLAGTWRETDIDLTTSGGGVVELPEKLVRVPTGPHLEADPELIARAVQQQLPKLRVCYEKWLKVDASARGRVEMDLAVSPQGKVTRARFSSAQPVPESISECLGRAARSLVLPKSSEEVELELPLNLGR